MIQATEADIEQAQQIANLTQTVAAIILKIEKMAAELESIKEANRNLLRLVHKKEQIMPGDAGRMVPHEGKVI